MSKLCSNCSAEIPDEAEFCPKCGSVQTKKIVCESCGYEVEGDVKFCPKCGNEIDPSLATIAKNVIKKDLKIKAIVLVVVIVLLAITLLVNAISSLFDSSDEPVSENSGSSSFSVYNIGDTFCFGAYEQDNNLENGPEEIEWLVLDKDESGIFVISKYCLDCMPYHNYWEYTPWENSVVRNWLNLEFIKSFNDEELEMIRVSEIVEDTTLFEVESTNTTRDKIYILSASEAEKYIVPATGSDYQEEAHPTAYAIANGAVTTDYYGNGFWWLRTTAEDDFGYGVFQTFITQYGWIDTFGADIYGYVTDYYSEEEIENPNGLGVRPVMWINYPAPSGGNSGSSTSSADNVSNASSSAEVSSKNSNDSEDYNDMGTTSLDAKFSKKELLKYYGYTLDEASEKGGLYWMYDDNTFIKLDNYWPSDFGYLMFIDPDEDSPYPLFSIKTPVKIAFFADYDVSPDTMIFSLYEIKKTGYTTSLWTNGFYLEDVRDDYYYGSIEDYMINQQNLKTLLPTMLDIYSLCDYNDGEVSYYIFDSKKGEEYVLSYYEGTRYTETLFTAKYEYLICDLNSYYPVYYGDFDLTQKGYAEVILNVEAPAMFEISYGYGGVSILEFK